MFAFARSCVILVLTAVTTSAVAGPTPSYGHDFVTIGDPGNRNVNIDEAPGFFPPFAIKGFDVGRVNYRYRMARTEVTVGQWLEFVNAYAPYYEGPTHSSRFTSDWLRFDSGTGEYYAIEGSENFAANMSWRYAARYCNWLHNGQGLDQISFENGAYDTSTFGRDDDGNYTDQREHNPDARFWLPTLNEWTKAMHWDPALNDGEGGYWRYPNSSNLEPVAGPPGVGDSNGGMNEFYDVGSYTNSVSPWGLLDGSGGESEWLETMGSGDTRYLRGSSWFLPTSFDDIDMLHSSWPDFTTSGGIRLVSFIPGPGVPSVLLPGLMFVSSRKRFHQ